MPEVPEVPQVPEMTETVRLDEIAFDEQYALVKAALLKRKTPAAAFEVRTDTQFHGLWLCGRCGKNNEASLCPKHENGWILRDYYETWSLTNRGTAVGRCGPCRSTRKSVTKAVCAKHGRRRRDH